MNARIWKLAAAVCLATVVGCSQDTGHDPAPPGPSISITPSANSVVANGANTVSFSVADTGGVAVTVTTDRGSFPGNVQSVAIPATTGGTTGTVVLTTCNSGTNVGCAGVANVRASSTTGSATASVNFTALSAACQTNCGADAQCTGQTCTLMAGGTGSCAAGVCSSAPACTQTNGGVELCSGGVDENCDGKIDCADTACDGQQCGATAANICVAGACKDIASGLAVKISSNRARLPANGSTPATITVQVLSGTDAATNQTVTISTTHGTLDRASGTTDREGNATFTLTAATPGVAVVTAASSLVPEAKASLSVTVPRLGSIQIPTGFASPPVLGVKTSGWNEEGHLTVQVLDDQGQPYPDGQVVHFEHQVLGGSTFAESTVPCTGTFSPGAPACIAYDAPVFGGTDNVDKTGAATAPLDSGIIAGTLVVTAQTKAGGDLGPGTVIRTVTLPGVAVVGAKASGANFSILCSPRNVPALAETDCSRSLVEAQITCAALMKDRFNNLLGTPTQVIFASEAAAVGKVATSTAYDPTVDNTSQKDLGTATQIFETLGAGLPFDVDPQVGEPSWAPANDRCNFVTRNPRDGVVTIIAIADGEEAFFDANGNGRYDAGEPFVDQGEPFVDQNDNGQWDAGEWFFDVNGDGLYTPGNGTWDGDAPTKIWTQTVIVYTGGAATVVKTAGPPATYLGTRWVSGAFPDACAATPAATPFSVNAKITGPPEIPPTSVGRVVVASDMNLNFLTKATTYGVQVEGAGKVKVDYWGLPGYADELGMFYRYWPCDQAGNCASQCRATGANTPCVMKPSLSAFSCGVAAGVTITGGDTPDGTNYVDYTVDVPWSVYLDAKVQHTVVTTSGTNN